MSGITTATGYRNLQSYSHVFQPVSAIQTSTESMGYDPAQYRKVIMLDMDETERDNVWIREEIRRVLVQNELLRHRFRYSQVDEERKRAYELEQRRREEEERRRWEDEIARRRAEDDERRRFEDEQRRRQEDERRRLDDERRRLELERRRLEEEEREKLHEIHRQPAILGRFPDAGDIVSVFVVRSEGLREVGRFAPMFVKVGFEGHQPLPYRTRSAQNSGEPVWEETLPELYMPHGARNLALEVHEDDSRELVGTGLFDLRHDENEIKAVDIINRSGVRQGKVYLRYSTRHPPPPPPPPVPVPVAKPATASGHSTLDLEIIKGKDLVDLDIISKCDPYVKLHWGTEATAFYTTQVSKGKNPVWNEGVAKVKVPEDVDFVTIMVWDKDSIGSDDFMGMHRLALLPAPDGEFSVPLHPRENEPADAKLAKKGYLGELNVRAHYRHVPGHGGPLGIPKPLPPVTGFVPTKCKLTIVSAEGLAPADSNGLSDPYVTIAIGTAPANKNHKTTVKKKTLGPIWNESFELVIPEKESHLTFTVFDDDKLSKDEFLGQAGFDTRPQTRASGSYVLTLQPRANNAMDEELAYRNHGLGKLRLKAEWVGAPPPAPPSPPVPPVVPSPPPAPVVDPTEEVEEF